MSQQGYSSDEEERRGEGWKTHKCMICFKRFSAYKNLKRHAQIQHEQQGGYQCGACGKRFGRSERLKKHREVKHGLPRRQTASHPSTPIQGAMGGVRTGARPQTPPLARGARRAAPSPTFTPLSPSRGRGIWQHAREVSLELPRPGRGSPTRTLYSAREMGTQTAPLPPSPQMSAPISRDAEVQTIRETMKEAASQATPEGHPQATQMSAPISKDAEVQTIRETRKEAASQATPEGHAQATQRSAPTTEEAGAQASWEVSTQAVQVGLPHPETAEAGVQCAEEEQAEARGELSPSDTSYSDTSSSDSSYGSLSSDED